MPAGQQLTFEIGAETVAASRMTRQPIAAELQSCDSLLCANARSSVDRVESGAASGKFDASVDLLAFAGGQRFATVLADPPWRFTNRTGKMAPEHRRLSRYGTMTVDEIANLPVPRLVASTAHLYLWVPNALLPEGLRVMHAWGFDYKTNLIWHKLRKDGGSDGRGVGFYFRNVTEIILFGVRGKNARTLPIFTDSAGGRRPSTRRSPWTRRCTPRPLTRSIATRTASPWKWSGTTRIHSSTVI